MSPVAIKYNSQVDQIWGIKTGEKQEFFVVENFGFPLSTARHFFQTGKKMIFTQYRESNQHIRTNKHPSNHTKEKASPPHL